MRRLLAYISAAAMVCLLALAFAFYSSSRTAIAADDPEKCNECLERVAQHYNQCIAIHGELAGVCGERMNQDVINCYRNFCEQ